MKSTRDRVAGERNFLPFGDVEKERFFLLIRELTKLYRIEVPALTVMSNHYHIVCAAPAAEGDRSDEQGRTGRREIVGCRRGRRRSQETI